MVWLIGSKGMLGSEVERQLFDYKIEYSATDIDIDITSETALKEHADKIFKSEGSNWIINCSAYTAVDKAEDEPDKAELLNITGVRNIAKCAAAYNAKVIHISTDYVFDGKSPYPLTEDLQTEPIGVYGRTKLAGENELRATTDTYFIIRTAWLYGLNGSNFVYTMIKLMNSKDSISVVNDQHGSPTNAEDLARFIFEIIRRDSDDYGIYHYSNDGNITWFDFAKEIYSLGKAEGIIETDCEINSCNSAQFPTKAKRPEYSLLSKEKVKQVFDIKVPEWKESLADFIEKIEEVK